MSNYTEKYLAYVKSVCNAPVATAMLENMCKSVDPNKVASDKEKKVVDLIINKYSSYPKEDLIRIIKNFGEYLDNNNIEIDDTFINDFEKDLLKK